MTKNKSRKMTKSTFAIIIMGIMMVAMLAFGGTFAYFTATTAEQSGSTKTGTVQLGTNTVGQFISTLVVPNQEILAADQKVEILNKSDVKTIIYVQFDVAFAKAATAGINAATPTEVGAEETPDAEGEYKLVYTVDEAWTAVDEHDGTYYLVVDASEGDTSNVTPTTVCDSILFQGWSQSTETSVGSLMGGTITVTISSKAISYDSLTGTGDAEKATAGYDVLFGA